MLRRGVKRFRNASSAVVRRRTVSRRRRFPRRTLARILRAPRSEVKHIINIFHANSNMNQDGLALNLCPIGQGTAVNQRVGLKVTPIGVSLHLKFVPPTYVQAVNGYQERQPYTNPANAFQNAWANCRFTLLRSRVRPDWTWNDQWFDPNGGYAYDRQVAPFDPQRSKVLADIHKTPSWGQSLAQGVTNNYLPICHVPEFHRNIRLLGKKYPVIFDGASTADIANNAIFCYVSSSAYTTLSPSNGGPYLMGTVTIWYLDS